MTTGSLFEFDKKASRVAPHPEHDESESLFGEPGKSRNQAAILGVIGKREPVSGFDITHSLR